jgi:hypothetical protein
MTNEVDIKQAPSYRYARELVEAFDRAGINGQPIEIPMKAVMDAPMPDYMPISNAVRCKLLFILTIYAENNRMGMLQDGINGMRTIIVSLAEEMGR